MGLNGPHFELVFLDGTVYEGWMSFQLNFEHKRYFSNYARLHKDK